jgi:putative restriction endonuclease
MSADSSLRSTAFQQLRLLQARYGDAIPWAAIDAGFMVNGERVHLSSKARGIFKPRRMSRGVLSVKTVMPRAGREKRYEDIASDDGVFEYRFMGKKPDSSDNRGLLESMEDETPLIYFHAVAPSIYQAVWPVFVTRWDAASLAVHIAPGEEVHGEALLPASIDTRRYIAVQARQRLFRELVLDAYGGCCGVTGLPERRLLHAAHIIADREERGLPVVSNGIAMSVLHHSAYDLNLLGIDPDWHVHINRDLLKIHDGPTVEHALKGVHGGVLREPQSPKHRPNRDFLAQRFEEFRKAA